MNENTPNLVEKLIKKLETSAEVIEDLKAVLEAVQVDFDVSLYIYIIILTYIAWQGIHWRSLWDYKRFRRKNRDERCLNKRIILNGNDQQ